MLIDDTKIYFTAVSLYAYLSTGPKTQRGVVDARFDFFVMSQYGAADTLAQLFFYVLPTESSYFWVTHGLISGNANDAMGYAA